MGVELRRRVEGRAHGRPFPLRRVRLLHGLHGSAGADAHRGSESSTSATPRPRRFAASKSRTRHGSAAAFQAGGHVAWLDAASWVHRGRRRSRDRRRLGQPVEQRAGMGGAPLDRMDRRHRSSDASPFSAESTAQSTVFYTPFNDAIQRQTRMACWAPGWNTARAIDNRLSAPTSGTSRTRTTSLGPSDPAQRRLPDVPGPRVSSPSISPSGDEAAHEGAAVAHLPSGLSRAPRDSAVALGQERQPFADKEADHHGAHHEHGAEGQRQRRRGDRWIGRRPPASAWRLQCSGT